ncbi:MAG: DUF3179 domain-containing protein [Acidimicrobiia bacterium]|nr:DUF3179 domain-containing protein [Acidimicrobiia bacterium]
MGRFAMLGAAIAMLTVACGGLQPSGREPSSSSSPGGEVTGASEPHDLPAEGLPTGPSALDDMNDPSFPPPLVDTADIMSGGPPPDGIPAIDEPSLTPVADAGPSLQDHDGVIALDINGDARAYPVDILIWHEIVNDTVGGVPVSITYCPLCNSAVSYERTINGVETTFGTSGRLYASALVMYDRATESLWTHYDGVAVAGLLTGTRLEPIASPLLAWGEFRQAHPDGHVLSRDTGFTRDYGRNPYLGYDSSDTSPFLFRGDVDQRAAAMQRVVGVAIDGSAAAFTLEAISSGEAHATNTEIGGNPVVILWQAGQASALEAADTSDGRDIGSVGVFQPDVDGQRLTLEAGEDGFVDTETGSTWNLTGRAYSGPLTGSQLERIPHLDTFWFAWSTYQPETELVKG